MKIELLVETFMVATLGKFQAVISPGLMHMSALKNLAFVVQTQRQPRLSRGCLNPSFMLQDLCYRDCRIDRQNVALGSKCIALTRSSRKLTLELLNTE